MDKNISNEVVVFHDETKIVANGKYKGHVLLFVPTRLSITQTTPMFGTESIEYNPLTTFYKKIMSIREENRIEKTKFHFADLGGKTWMGYDLGVRRVVELGVDALKNKSPIYFKQALNCKLAVIFYPSNSDLSLYGGGKKGEQQLRHDETILRMLLKGAANFLYNESNQVVITKLISDGNPNYRQFDVDRLIWTMTYDVLNGRSPLRDYATISKDAQIIHLPSDHKLYQPESEEHIYANFLQLADLLLGSVIRSCYVGIVKFPKPPRIGSIISSKKDVVAYPVREMLEKTKRGKGFVNSGHYNSFTISQVEFTNALVHFQQVDPLKLKICEETMEFDFSEKQNSQ